MTMALTKRNLAVVGLSLIAAACVDLSGSRRPQTTAQPEIKDVGNYIPNNLPPGVEFNEDQIRADQFIKIRTEMIITGLTCGPYYKNDNLFYDYSVFRERQADLFRTSTSTLEDLFDRHLRGNKKRLFDSYDTLMANEEAQVRQALGPDVYCKEREAQYRQLVNFTPQQMQQYLDQSVAFYRDRYPGGTATAGKPDNGAVSAKSPG